MRSIVKGVMRTTSGRLNLWFSRQCSNVWLTSNAVPLHVWVHTRKLCSSNHQFQTATAASDSINRLVFKPAHLPFTAEQLIEGGSEGRKEGRGIGGGGEISYIFYIYYILLLLSRASTGLIVSLVCSAALRWLQTASHGRRRLPPPNICGFHTPPPETACTEG